MARTKRVPLPCSPEVCGTNYSACGKNVTYVAGKCRCDPCYAATMEVQRIYRARNAAVLHEKRRRYDQANRDAILNTQRRYRDANPAVRERERLWRDRNRESERARQREWKDANREFTREQDRRRKAREISAPTVPFTLDQLREKWAYHGNACYLRLEGCTGGADHAEHVKPLSKGGAHMLANLRPACRTCNSRKGAKWPFLHYGQRPHVNVD